MADEEHARIRVVVIEDDPMALEWFQDRLDAPPIEVVAGCQTAVDGIQAVEDFRPHVVFVDMQLDHDPRAGVLVIKEIMERWPDVRCCVVTSTDLTGQYLMEAFHVGALGYWRKGYAKTQLPTIAERLTHGEVTIEPDLAALFLAADPSARSAVSPGNYKAPHLSRRNLQVLNLIRQGKTNQEIARELDIAENTVKTYVRQIMVAYQVSGNGGRYRASFLAQMQASREADRRRAGVQVRTQAGQEADRRRSP